MQWPVGQLQNPRRMRRRSFDRLPVYQNTQRGRSLKTFDYVSGRITDDLSNCNGDANHSADCERHPDEFQEPRNSVTRNPLEEPQ